MLVPNTSRLQTRRLLKYFQTAYRTCLCLCRLALLLLLYCIHIFVVDVRYNMECMVFIVLGTKLLKDVGCNEVVLRADKRNFKYCSGVRPTATALCLLWRIIKLYDVSFTCTYTFNRHVEKELFKMPSLDGDLLAIRDGRNLSSWCPSPATLWN